MKYFTANLLSRYNDTCKKTREQAEKDWDIAIDKYKSEFELCKSKLSKSFLNEYVSHGFHDYKLNSITLVREESINGNGKEKTVITIELRKKKQFQIFLKGITAFECTFNINEIDEWEITLLYSEIFLANNNQLSIEILFSNGGVLKVLCKKIMI